MLKARLVVITLLLAGCVTIKINKPPYADLNKNSYGPFTNYVDRGTKQSVTPPMCDPNAGKDQDVHKLSRDIVAEIFKPIEGIEQVEPTIQQEDLQGYFKISGDLSSYPVTIVSRDQSGIVFWYYGNLIYLDEVMNAAKKYCSKRRKVAYYVGSARHCSDPKVQPVTINHGSPYRIDTYVISDFDCR